MLFRNRVLCGIAAVCILAGCSNQSQQEPKALNQQGGEAEVLFQQGAEMEIPPGVKYTKASEEDNRKAFDFLQSLVAGVRPNEELRKSTSKVMICGPGLWSLLVGVAPQELQDAMPVTFIVPNLISGGAQSYDGKGFKTDEQQEAFWELFQMYLDGFRLRPENRPKSPIQIRKANAHELQYYWSIIPYESITEPFFVVAIDERGFLFDFIMEDGEPKVFTIDLVGTIEEE